MTLIIFKNIINTYMLGVTENSQFFYLLFLSELVVILLNQGWTKDCGSPAFEAEVLCKIKGVKVQCDNNEGFRSFS